MSARTDAHGTEREVRILLDDMTVVTVRADPDSVDCINPGTGVAS